MGEIGGWRFSKLLTAVTAEIYDQRIVLWQSHAWLCLIGIDCRIPASKNRYPLTIKAESRVLRSDSQDAIGIGGKMRQIGIAGQFTEKNVGRMELQQFPGLSRCGLGGEKFFAGAQIVGCRLHTFGEQLLGSRKIARARLQFRQAKRGSCPEFWRAQGFFVRGDGGTLLTKSIVSDAEVVRDFGVGGVTSGSSGKKRGGFREAQQSSVEASDGLQQFVARRKLLQGLLIAGHRGEQVAIKLEGLCRLQPVVCVFEPVFGKLVGLLWADFYL